MFRVRGEGEEGTGVCKQASLDPSVHNFLFLMKNLEYSSVGGQ